MKKVNVLRKNHPCFAYKSFDYKVEENDLKADFCFSIGQDIHFRPRLTIQNIDKKRLVKVGEKTLNNFVFHLGLIEMISYWKATCSPKIVVKAGPLEKEQIKWWKDLIIKGMGQFFYENKIDWRKPGFLKIVCQNDEKYKKFEGRLKNRYLVPVGGGKDSIVTLERLKKQRKKINCFLVNPTQVSKKVMKAAGIKKPIVVKRRIDPALLRLNKKGFLNGHTPFTALLSFLSVFCAVLFDCKNIAFSNEKSADEGNVKYLGRIINHQWSKSSEFEKMFKSYCNKHLAKNVNYYSYLRKYTELEISIMFTKYPKYFPAFSSCNIASKTGKRWCDNCPKCLFVYASLYPFLNKKELLKIFEGRDVFENKKLLPVMKALLGQGRMKPFECVGTYKENRKTFGLSFKKAGKIGKIPYLLTKLDFSL